MGRSLSPLLRRELENLDKDADSRRSAMKALKSFVKDLDSKAIPLFLAQVSETKENGASSGEYTISLYEVLARVHGPNIVPQIDNIMTTIIKTLSSSAGSFALHQACSKVVPAIARYAMDPTTAEDKKRYIIHSLCKPLSNCLLGNQENLSSGAALCLQALVESDNWRFASNEMVNEVCQRVAGALEKHTQTSSHMALVTALAKHNSLTVEAYSRLLIMSGLQILNSGFVDANSQKQFSAIHMVSSLMRCLDPKSIFSELDLIIKEMEKCQSDRMPFVTGAAFEALQTAKRICAENGSKLERDVGSITGSNFERRENIRRRNVDSSGEKSPLTASPESQTVDSAFGYDYFMESPISMNQVPQLGSYDRRSVNRKLWRKNENCGLDVSLKDGIFSEITPRSAITNSQHGEFSDNRGDLCENFAGFMQGSVENGFVRSSTPSPQRSQSHINIDSVKIFTTPRKLIRSLQDPNGVISDFPERQTRRFGSPLSSKFEWTPTSKHEQNGLAQVMHCNIERGENFSFSGEQFHFQSESVSSTGDMLPDADLQVSPEVVCGNQNESHSANIQKGNIKSGRSIVGCLLLVLFAIFLFLLGFDNQDNSYVLVPT
ncbi:ARM repeat superfamily protein [Abeliophyllum distichum]|uniref:ARM repeat superfamily protein n=1 Tax=Abeliophyllum distichum TaxID=126358 RepID=A0ABD1VCY0_9LAMI